ncbi:MAG: isochorismatase family protein [Actinomycetota bacterium]|nr:isochorismatase family protein [Actinomycetota bacterium]
MIAYGARTALLVVDVQNDFADSKGSLYVKGAEDILPLLNEEVAKARGAGALVVCTQDWHPPETPHFQDYGGIWPVHCVRETWGAALHPALDVEGEIVRKGAGGEDGYSGFTVKDVDSGEERSTRLEELLHARNIGRAVVAGLATDYCVKETAIDAARLGFEVSVRRAAVRAVNLQPGDDQRAFEAMAEAGVQVI